MHTEAHTETDLGVGPVQDDLGEAPLARVDDVVEDQVHQPAHVLLTPQPLQHRLVVVLVVLVLVLAAAVVVVVLVVVVVVVVVVAAAAAVRRNCGGRSE
jgi:hypothetical protein